MKRKGAIESYIGFSLRARKILLGTGAVETFRGRVYLLLLCKSAAENTVKKAEKLSRRLGAELLRVEDLASLVHKPNCKLCALTDESLARAAAGCIEPDAGQNNIEQTNKEQ